MGINKLHKCECSECEERGEALRNIQNTPFSTVNDSESLRHTIRVMQAIAGGLQIRDGIVRLNCCTTRQACRAPDCKCPPL